MDLIDAIVTDNKNKVFELLHNGADVLNCDACDFITPLHHAVSTASIEIIFLLTEHGADPHERYSKTGQTAFELACSLNRADVLSFFCNQNSSEMKH